MTRSPHVSQNPGAEFVILLASSILHESSAAAFTAPSADEDLYHLDPAGAQALRRPSSILLGRPAATLQYVSQLATLHVLVGTCLILSLTGHWRLEGSRVASS